VYEAVARHELDPYEAADRLLRLLGDTGVAGERWPSRPAKRWPLRAGRS